MTATTMTTECSRIKKGKTLLQGVCELRRLYQVTSFTRCVYFLWKFEYFCVESIRRWNIKETNKIFDDIFSKSLPKMSEQYLCRTIIATDIFHFFSRIVNGNWHFYRFNSQLFCFVSSIYFNWSGAVYPSTIHSATLVHRTLDWLLLKFSVIEIRFREEKLMARGKILRNYLFVWKMWFQELVVDANPSWHALLMLQLQQMIVHLLDQSRYETLEDKFLFCGLTVLGSEEIVYYSREASNARRYSHRWSEKRLNRVELIFASSSNMVSILINSKWHLKTIGNG